MSSGDGSFPLGIARGPNGREDAGNWLESSKACGLSSRDEDKEFNEALEAIDDALEWGRTRRVGSEGAGSILSLANLSFNASAARDEDEGAGLADMALNLEARSWTVGGERGLSPGLPLRV